MNKQKIFSRMKKKHMKTIRKAAAEFNPWDWDYFYAVVKPMILYYHDFYHGPELVMQTQESLYPIQKSLAEACECIKKIDMARLDSERDIVILIENMRKLFDIIGENLLYWWD